MKHIQKRWEETSKYYQADATIGVKSAHYGPYAPDENKLRLLGNVKGKKILEIGCGGGQCSIAFAKQGAICTGVDFSKEQLKYAKTLASKNKVSIKFVNKNIQDLNRFKSDYYDIVFSAFALLYVPNLDKCFKEVYRVLKPKGLFVFSLGNPFYDVISSKTLRIEKNYNKTGKYVEIEIWPDGKKHKFIAYRRKVSDIFNSLKKAGFNVDKIIEPYDAKTEKAWTKGGWKDIYPKKLNEKIGPTIIFKARK